MDAIEINYELAKAGASQTAVARELGCAPQTVNRVIHGTTLSYRIASTVARRIGRDVREIWPNAYDDRVAA